MTIEIHQPELEALILERMATGRYQTLEEAVLEAFRSSSAEDQPTPDTPKQSLTKFLKDSPLWNSGLEFERSKDLPRPVDL